MTGHAILTPMLMVIIMLTGDLLGMSLTTGTVRPSATTTYANRERQRMTFSRPGPLLIGSSVADLLIASTLAICGIAMTALPAALVAGTLLAAVAFAAIVNVVKAPLFKHLRIT